MSEASRPASPRVLLVITPWASPYFPGISIALLRSILEREGISCDLFYANLLFSKIIEGDSRYEENISRGSIAEIAFTPYYFETDPSEAARTLFDYFREFTTDPVGRTREPYEHLVACAGRFVEEAVAAVPWGEYDVIGFSIMFQQTLASLALARRVRMLHPEVRIVFGGASCAHPMGQELLRSFPEIDYVVAGEADAIIAPFVREIAAGVSAIKTPGILYRGPKGEVLSSGRDAPFRDLDSLPVPDYGPYFDYVERLGLKHFHPYLYIENSRGCWWGEKHHCTFCGIDDKYMVYRSKSVPRVLDEILTLSERHRLTSFLTADNILDYRHIDTLLPELRRLRDHEGYDFTFFFELKSNLRREHVRALREAGVTQVQPGIESFSDKILTLMDKGSSGIQQLQTLRLLAEQGIEPVWNIIYMNPEERAVDYRMMIDMIPFMRHLPPVRKQGQVDMLLQRYSPYFERPERYGVENIRPQQFYAQIFPGEGIDLEKLAFFFDYSHRAFDDTALKMMHRELDESLAEWRSLYRPDSLVQWRGPGFTQIVDRRRWSSETARTNETARVVILEGIEAEILGACDRVRGEAELVKSIGTADPPAAQAALDRLVAERFLYRSPKRQYLALPLRADRKPRPLGSAYDGA